MGYINDFVRCSLFDMYVKGGSKKIWHEMIVFFCDLNKCEKSCPPKPHYLANKIQKIICIQLLCNYPLGITIIV
jgi:hypothetical protein